MASHHPFMKQHLQKWLVNNKRSGCEVVGIKKVFKLLSLHTLLWVVGFVSLKQYDFVDSSSIHEVS